MWEKIRLSRPSGMRIENPPSDPDTTPVAVPWIRMFTPTSGAPAVSVTRPLTTLSGAFCGAEAFPPPLRPRITIVSSSIEYSSRVPRSASSSTSRTGASALLKEMPPIPRTASLL